jgi:hypothetical protein
MNMNLDFYTQVIAVAETVQDQRFVREDALFMALCAKYPDMTIRTFRRIIDFVTRAQLVANTDHVLRWIGGDFRITKISEVE